MRKDRKGNQNSIKTERMIMIGSSVFVLAALTMTGIYMRHGSEESQDNGYVVDFTQLQERTDQKLDELAQNNMTDLEEGVDQIMEDDLDYMPLEEDPLELGTTPVGSAQVDNTQAADDEDEEEEEPQTALTAADSTQIEIPKVEEQEIVPEAEPMPVIADTVETRELHFSEENGLIRPVEGEVLIPYSMDKTVYFATLNQYKYNPAVIFKADEGVNVQACAEGQVLEIYQDSEIGQAVRLDLGDGYQVVYGQLQNVRVSENDYVNSGDILGTVAAPTMYYCEEGSNLYFEMVKNGEEVNPESLF